MELLLRSRLQSPVHAKTPVGIRLSRHRAIDSVWSCSSVLTSRQAAAGVPALAHKVLCYPHEAASLMISTQDQGPRQTSSGRSEPHAVGADSVQGDFEPLICMLQGLGRMEKSGSQGR